MQMWAGVSQSLADMAGAGPVPMQTWGDLGLVSTCNLIFHLRLAVPAAAYDPTGICVKEKSRFTVSSKSAENVHWTRTRFKCSLAA